MKVISFHFLWHIADSMTDITPHLSIIVSCSFFILDNEFMIPWGFINGCPNDNIAINMGKWFLHRLVGLNFCQCPQVRLIMIQAVKSVGCNYDPYKLIWNDEHK